MKRAVSSIELLESRVAPAGIISVAVSAGTLLLKSISGASGDETITIAQNAPGELTLTPSNGTQLQLGTVLLPANQAQTIEALFGSINVALGEGNDVVSVENVQMAKTLAVDLGNGTNELTLGGDGSYGAVSIKGGSGRDVVQIVDADFTVAGAVSIRLADGANSVGATLSGGFLVGRGLSISTGAGSDEVDIQAPRIVIGGKLGIASGAGSDDLKLVGTESVTITGEARIASLGVPGGAGFVEQKIRGENITIGPVFFSIGTADSSSQELAAFGDSLLVAGSVSMTTIGDANGPHSAEIRGGASDSSAIQGNATFKGHSFVLMGQVGVLTGNLSVVSGATLQLLSFQGGTSVDLAFRVGGKVTIDSTKAKTAVAQSTITFGRFVPDGPLVVRDGPANVSVSFVDSRLLGSVAVSMGAGADTFNIDSSNFPEATIFFGPVSFRGEAGADTFLIGGNQPGDVVSFRNKVTADGGLDTDTLTLGPQVTFASAFPLVQISIP